MATIEWLLALRENVAAVPKKIFTVAEKTMVITEKVLAVRKGTMATVALEDSRSQQEMGEVIWMDCSAKKKG